MAAIFSAPCRIWQQELAAVSRSYKTLSFEGHAMNAQTYSSGAIVLIALLPVLPLMLYLRHRRNSPRKPVLLALGAASLALLGVGLALATGYGTP